MIGTVAASQLAFLIGLVRDVRAAISEVRL
jgi:hypothetical protein